MATNQPEARYNALYVTLAMERLDLLKVLARHTGARDVLYPGCSIHVTPSFVFPRVTYVDRSPSARDFFADLAAVRAFVDRQRRYDPPASVTFLEADYQCSLPLPDDQFDLLLALGADGIARSCFRHVKPGGYLLTDNHRDEAGEAARCGAYALAGVFVRRKGDYHLDEVDLDRYLQPRRLSGNERHFRRQTGRPEYTRQADYYLFHRLAGACP